MFLALPTRQGGGQGESFPIFIVVGSPGAIEPLFICFISLINIKTITLAITSGLSLSLITVTTVRRLLMLQPASRRACS